jgi:hypothetical protein
MLGKRLIAGAIQLSYNYAFPVGLQALLEQATGIDEAFGKFGNDARTKSLSSRKVSTSFHLNHHYRATPDRGPFHPIHFPPKDAYDSHRPGGRIGVESAAASASRYLACATKCYEE